MRRSTPCGAGSFGSYGPTPPLPGSKPEWYTTKLTSGLRAAAGPMSLGSASSGVDPTIDEMPLCVQMIGGPISRTWSMNRWPICGRLGSWSSK